MAHVQQQLDRRSRAYLANQRSDGFRKEPTQREDLRRRVKNRPVVACKQRRAAPAGGDRVDLFLRNACCQSRLDLPVPFIGDALGDQHQQDRKHSVTLLERDEVLESYVTRTRDKAAALTFMKKTLKRHGPPETITTDGLRSYRAAMNELGNAERQEIGRWANNRVENSHLPFRRRERAMLRFGQMKTLQKFASVHANVHNHFSLERHLTDRQTYKDRRSAALAEWQILAS